MTLSTKVFVSIRTIMKESAVRQVSFLVLFQKVCALGQLCDDVM